MCAYSNLLETHSNDNILKDDVEKLKKYTPLLLVFIVTIVAFSQIKNQPVFVDELVHYQVVKDFCHLNFWLPPHLVNIPGYHIALAVPCYILNFIIRADTLAVIRLLSLILSLVALPIFFFLNRGFEPNLAAIKTLQLYFLPLAFPVFFLVYTDTPSLVLVLAAFYMAYRKKYSLAGLLAATSVAFRQNNIAWLGFLAVFIFFQQFSGKIRPDILLRYLSSIWLFVVGAAGFVIFVYLNKGVTLGEPEDWAHPFFSLHLGNIYFLLFLFFFLFLPINLVNLPRILRLLLRKKGLLLFAPLITVALFIYLATFRNDHPYNQHTFALHNRLLVYFTANQFRRITFFLPVAYSILSLVVTPFHNRNFYLLYPFAFLYLIPSWLIEPRYYIVPFAFFQLFRAVENKNIENIVVVVNMVLSLLMFVGILGGRFFL